MKKLQQDHHKTDIVFGLEPTGHYWFPLMDFLQSQGIKVVSVNPYHVNKSKELEDNSPTKSDYKDAKVIADLVRNGRYTKPKLPEGVYADLRTTMNLREKVIGNLKQVALRIQNWLDRFFPEYMDVFKDWKGKASLTTLRYFPMPQDIVALGANEIMVKWKTKINGGIGLKRAEKLVACARHSIGLTEGLTGARLELESLLEQYELYNRQLEKIMEAVGEQLEKISGVTEMSTIPGVGVVTLAGFLAEVGDLSNYDHPQQIIRLAGLNLMENSSGKRKGRTTITKRGRSRLRALLFRCVLPMVAKNKAFKGLHHYYTTRGERPLKKKQSIIALCGKLIRILYTLGTRKIPYHTEDAVGPISQKVA